MSLLFPQLEISTESIFGSHGVGDGEGLPLPRIQVPGNILCCQIQTLSSPVGAVVEIISVPHKRLMTDFGLPAFMITFIIIFIKESLPLPLQTWHVWQQCKAPNPILEQEKISLLFLCYR